MVLTYQMVRAFLDKLPYAVVVCPCSEFLCKPGGRLRLPVGEFDESAERDLFDDFRNAHEESPVWLIGRGMSRDLAICLMRGGEDRRHAE